MEVGNILEGTIQPPSAEPIYNIGAVTRLTGIPITSLRAWERRYGFPHSSGRTPGGHRLYSEKDVTLLRQRLLLWLVSGPPARDTRPIVLACAPGEWHEGGLLMLGVLLRRQGWPVEYLGQDVPFADLALFVEQVKTQALVLVGMMEDTARTLADWPNHITPSAGYPLVTFAGRAFVMWPELKARVPGIYLGDNVQEGVERLEGLLR